MKTTARTAGRAAVALALLGASASVGLAPAAAASTSGSTPKGSSWVRAAHLVPGMGVMSVTLAPFDGTGGARIDLTGRAGYGAVTPYRATGTGFYSVQMTPVGSARGSRPVLTGSVRLEAGRAYTVAALGTTGATRLATLPDDLTPPGGGTARVRLVPAALAASAVTVIARGGPTLADGARFGRATGYAAVPAGPWTLRTTAGQGATDARGAASTANPTASPLTLASGSVYTLFVLDGPGGRLTVKPVLDAAGAVRMPTGGAQLGGGGLAGGEAATATPIAAGAGAGATWSRAAGTVVPGAAVPGAAVPGAALLGAALLGAAALVTASRRRG